MAQQSDNQSRSGRQPAAKLGTRSRGLLMMIFGLGLAKWQVYDPLHAREQGLEQVTVDAVLVGLAVLLSVFGAAAQQGTQAEREKPPRPLSSALRILAFAAPGLPGCGDLARIDGLRGRPDPSRWPHRRRRGFALPFLAYGLKVCGKRLEGSATYRAGKPLAERLVTRPIDLHLK